MNPTAIQDQSIDKLNFSESFKKMAKLQKLENLTELLDRTPEQILSIPGLTFEHLQEYRAFSAENDLDHLQKN